MIEVYMLQPVTSACELFESRRRSVVIEPDLSDLMGDPITQAVMAADRVDHDQLTTLLRQMGESLR